jgi:hypothetical protein
LRQAVAHVFGDQVLLISNEAFGHLVELFVFLFFFFFCSNCSRVGIANALIKGEIANTRLKYALVIRFVMSDCQSDPRRKVEW